MSTEQKGELIKDRRPDGEMLKNRPIGEGDVLKSEGKKGNPLWRDDKLNEEKKKKQKLNEDFTADFKRKFEIKSKYTWE